MEKKILIGVGVVFLFVFQSLADALDSWTKVAQTPYGNYINILATNGAYVAVSHGATSYSTPAGGCSISYDGTNWIHTVTGFATGLTYGQGFFAYSSSSYGDDIGSVLMAATGSSNLNFQLSAPYGANADQVGHGIAYGDGRFAAVGYTYYDVQTAQVSTSSDGTNWHQQNIWYNNGTRIVYLATNLYPTCVAIGNGKIVTAGFSWSFTKYHIWYSLDGVIWRPSTQTGIPDFTAMKFINGQFYAITSAGFCYVSADGSTWASYAPLPPTTIVRGAYGSNLFINVRPGFPISTSLDGTNWNTRSQVLTNQISDITFDGTNFFVCTTDGGIFRSASAIPSLVGKPMSTGQSVQLMVTNGIGPSYQLQVSSNLLNWSNLYTFTNIQAVSTYLDTPGTGTKNRYYRLVSQ